MKFKMQNIAITMPSSLFLFDIQYSMFIVCIEIALLLNSNVKSNSNIGHRRTPKYTYAKANTNTNETHITQD